MTPLSRKQTRSVVRKLAKVPKEKVFKVVFIESCNLPVCFSKDIVLAEGFVTIKENEIEREIMTNLVSILEQCNYMNIDSLEILLYSSKTLYVPCSAQGFVWCLDSVKMNVGQGKLYVMVKEKVNTPSKKFYNLTDFIQPLCICNKCAFQVIYYCLEEALCKSLMD